MEILINTSIYLSYIMEGYIAYLYFEMMFERKHQSSVCRVIVYITGFSLLFFLFLMKNPIVNMFGALVIMTLSGMISFKAKWLKALFHSGVMVVLLIACESLVIAVFNMLFSVNAASINTPPVIVIVSIASKILMFMTCKFIGFFAVKDNAVSKWTVFLFAVPVASILCMIIIFNQSAQLQLNFVQNTLNCFASVMLLVANLLVFYVYERALKNEKELSDIRLSEQRRELDYEYYRMLEENRNEMRIIIHDIKHHLSLIRCMAWESDDNDIAQYIDSFQQTSYFATSALLSGNRIADVVLAQKRLLCQKKGIEFEFEHNNTDLSFVSDSDLCAIISNAMDNAIESAMKSNKKFVAVSFYSSENNCFCFLEFINSCDTKPVKRARGFVSSKNGKYHGIGLYSIKRMAEKYDGEMVVQYTEDNKFHTTVMLQRVSNGTK